MKKQGRNHGLSKTGTAKAWYCMRSRVLCPSSNGHENYRNYTIDPRWNKLVNFYEDMGERPAGMSLDRIDNNRGYSKENCRWATPAQQAQNTRVTRLSMEKVREIRAMLVEFRSSVVARKYGLAQSTIANIKYGKIWKEVANV